MQHMFSAGLEKMTLQAMDSSYCSLKIHCIQELAKDGTPAVIEDL